MAEITLRAYVKEIDDLIEREQLDEAIAHCRHILETYPKHLETYRLLGKAYLEAKRYGDAADLFQRVLSAVPDDFVSHIGMSIVREDEGNLDASIWHMERAFETNPANPAIQQELRRLIGKRDGLEPHKVRLTRGALARMYAHGELYPQAIAELRSALQEDADRPDLQVLLANLYWRTDQKEQAAEVAKQILDKLPFCRDANRIAAGQLQSMGRTDEAAPMHRRLASLDPYAAFVETATIDPSGIDAGTVHLEKLEWRPGHPVAAPVLSRPSWTDSLGAGLRAEPKPTPAAAPVPEGPLPTWLADESVGEAPAPAPAPAPEAAPRPPEPTLAAREEAAASVHPFAGAKEPLSAEIPGWMREAGWSESTGEAVEGPISFSDDELSGTPSGASEGELAPASLPDWLKDIAPPQADETGEEPSLPDWQAEAAAVAPAPETPAMPEPVRGGKPGEVPTWLEEPSPGATETIVTWLGDRSARAAALQQPPAPPEEPAPEAEQPPDWVTQGGFLDEEPVEERKSPEPEAPPAWLTGVAEAAASEDALSAEPPSWVMEEEEAALEVEPEEEEVAPLPPAQEAPDWLRAIAEPGTGAPASAQPEGDWLAGLASAAAQSRREDTGGPEWLRGIGEEEQQPAGQPEARPAPDWLRGLAGPEPPAEAAEPAGPEWLSEAPATPKPPSTAPAGLEWLRGIGEEEPSIPAETPPAADDDWLRGLAEISAEAVPEPSSAAPEPEGAWPSEAVEPAAMAPGSLDTPDWLSRLAESAPAPEAPGHIEPSAWGQEAVAEGEPQPSAEPNWLSEMPGVGAAQAATAPEPEEDWLRGLLDEAALPSDLASPQAEEAAGADWFAVQGEEAGAEAGSEIRARTTGWLREVGEQATPPDALEPPGTPDWLKEFEAAAGPEARPSDETVVGAATGRSRPPISALDASAAGELGEDDVQKWLEALASRQEAGGAAAMEEPPRVDTGSFFPPAVPAEEATLPEEPEEGIDWLEQMAEKAEPPVTAWQPIDQEPEAVTTPEPAEAEAEEEVVPDWLRSLATEPAPSEPIAEEAAAEEQGPDWLLSAAASTVVARSTVHPPEAPAEPVMPPAEAFEPPAEEAEEAPAWLSVQESAVEPEPESGSEFEQAPDWLLSAAGEAEPPPGQPRYEEEETGMPDWLRQAAEAPETSEGLPPSMEAPEPVEEAVEPKVTEPAPTAAPVPEPSWMKPSEPVKVRPVTPESEIVVPEWLRVPVEAPRAAVRPPEPVPEPSRAEPKPAPPEVERPLMEPAPVVQAVAEVPVPTPVAEAPSPPTEVSTPPPEAPKPAKEPADQKRAPKGRTTARTVQEILAAARQAMAADEFEGAVKHYGTLIRRRSLLEDVMADLEAAIDRLPDRPELWQALGDAYMKADRAAEAVEAYRRGLASL